MKGQSQSVNDLHFWKESNKMIKFLKHQPLSPVKINKSIPSKNHSFNEQLKSESYIKMKETTINSSHQIENPELNTPRRGNGKGQLGSELNISLSTAEKTLITCKSEQFFKNTGNSQKTQFFKRKPFQRKETNLRRKNSTIYLKKQNSTDNNTIQGLKRQLKQKQIQLQASNKKIQQLQALNKQQSIQICKLTKQIKLYFTENQQLTKQMQDLMLETRFFNEKQMTTFIEESTVENILEPYDSSFFQTEIQHRDSYIYDLRKQIQNLTIKQFQLKKQHHQEKTQLLQNNQKKYIALMDSYRRLQKKTSFNRQIRLSLSPQ